MKRVFVYLSIVLIISSCREEIQNKRIVGNVFGTTYSVQYAGYESEVDFQEQFDKLFYIINKSMSTYQANSIISKINRNEETTIDSHFRKVFEASKEIYKLTNGSFDPTIGVMVNAWDFGPDAATIELDQVKVDSLMQLVGLDKVTREDNVINKELSGIQLDFNAIAKGYAVDVIAEFLETQAIENYLVEIGGEVRTKGINMSSEQPWRIGVENPNFDGSQTIMKAITMGDEAMATSGTYRKFKVDESGNRYAHIIDAKTGYPSKTSLLSISVIAKDCMTADAYATAFKTMGVEGVTSFLKDHPELKVFLIFENDKNELETMSLNNFPEN